MKLQSDRAQQAVPAVDNEVEAVFVSGNDMLGGITESAFWKDAALDVGDDAGALDGADSGAGFRGIRVDRQVRAGGEDRGIEPRTTDGHEGVTPCA